MWQEAIATSLGSCSCFEGAAETPPKAKSTRGVWIPPILELCGMQDWPLVQSELISLGTSPAGGQTLGLSGSPLQSTLSQRNCTLLPQFPHLRAGKHDTTPTG